MIGETPLFWAVISYFCASEVTSEVDTEVTSEVDTEVTSEVTTEVT